MQNPLSFVYFSHFILPLITVGYGVDLQGLYSCFVHILFTVCSIGSCRMTASYLRNKCRLQTEEAMWRLYVAYIRYKDYGAYRVGREADGEREAVK